MRPDPTGCRPRVLFAAAAGAALLLFAPRIAQDPRPRQDRGKAAAPPASVALVPAATAPVPVTRGPATGPEARQADSGRLGTAPGSAGMIVGIDPETGKPGMPSAEARARLSQNPALDRSMTGLTVVTHPDGSKHLDLKGRFQEYMVLRLTPDGRKVETCVQGPEVEAALRGDAEPVADPAPGPESTSAPSHANEVR